MRKYLHLAWVLGSLYAAPASTLTAYEEFDEALRQGSRELAEAIARRESKINPDKAETLVMTGRLYMLNGEKFKQDTSREGSIGAWLLPEVPIEQEALRAYTKAIEIDPSNAPAYIYRSGLLGNLGHCARGIEDAKKGLGLTTSVREKSLAHYQRGYNLMRCDFYETALADFNESIQFDPTPGRAYYGLARTYLLIDKPKDALTAIEEALKRKQTPSAARTYQADALLRLGRVDDAARAIRQAVDDMPKYAYAYEVWAMINLKQERLELAVAHAQQAIRLRPNSPLPYRLKAEALDKMGATHEATRVLLAAPIKDVVAEGKARPKPPGYDAPRYYKCSNSSDKLYILGDPIEPDYSCITKSLEAMTQPQPPPVVKRTHPKSVQRVIDRIEKGRSPIQKR
ncbi:hypothetical protein F183_A21060 [Bryobacterales bacterium F-183]|nr:hypothetical protein F183_A21060 [Bryobacterales bacterium F-183]